MAGFPGLKVPHSKQAGVSKMLKAMGKETGDLGAAYYTETVTAHQWEGARGMARSWRQDK